MNMKYDFTSIIDRKGYDAIAVDLPENYLGNYAAVNSRLCRPSRKQSSTE